MKINTSINVVAHKEVVRLRNLSPNLKKFHEIMELPMDVAADYDRCPDRDNIGFFRKNFLGLGNKKAYLFAERLDL